METGGTLKYIKTKDESSSYVSCCCRCRDSGTALPFSRSAASLSAFRTVCSQVTVRVCLPVCARMC